MEGGAGLDPAPPSSLLVALSDAFEQVSNKQHQIADQECTKRVLTDDWNGHPRLASNQGHEGNQNGNYQCDLSWRADIHVFPPYRFV